MTRIFKERDWEELTKGDESTTAEFCEPISSASTDCVENNHFPTPVKAKQLSPQELLQMREREWAEIEAYIEEGESALREAEYTPSQISEADESGPNLQIVSRGQALPVTTESQSQFSQSQPSEVAAESCIHSSQGKCFYCTSVAFEREQCILNGGYWSD